MENNAIATMNKVDELISKTNKYMNKIKNQTARSEKLKREIEEVMQEKIKSGTRLTYSQMEKYQIYSYELYNTYSNLKFKIEELGKSQQMLCSQNEVMLVDEIFLHLNLEMYTVYNMQVEILEELEVFVKMQEVVLEMLDCSPTSLLILDSKNNFSFA